VVESGRAKVCPVVAVVSNIWKNSPIVMFKGIPESKLSLTKLVSLQHI
jgi:hypothetical protein